MERTERSGSTSSSSSSTTGLSRLPRFTPSRPTPVLATNSASSTPRLGATAPRAAPEFKQPKLSTVQVLSRSIKRRYSGRKGPARASPSASKPVTKKPLVIPPPLLGKRVATEGNVVPVKKPRVLGERNRPMPATTLRPVATQRPVTTKPVINQEANKAGTSKRPIVKSRRENTTLSDSSEAGPSTSNTVPPKRKVQPWDIKGKLELSQETNRKLKEDLDAAVNRIKDLETLTGSAEGTIQSLNTQLTEEKALSAARLELVHDRDERLRKADEDRAELMRKAELERLELNRVVDSLKADVAQKEEAIKRLESQLVESQSRCRDQAAEIDKLHDIRKVLHNQVQDLKGNIRVLCRVRPPTPKETSLSSPLCHIQYIDSTSLELYKMKEELGGKKKSSPTFSFDRVFAAGSTQADIYAELDQLVQSCLDGYNACVFAYGQTGSGKTFTMDGLTDPESERGMIPRTVETIFRQIEKLKELGWEYSAEVFFVEIYNEQIHDLLNYNSGLPHDVRMVPNNKSDVCVSNLKVERVHTQEELNSLMDLARNNRFVASTVCNTHSSRSHFIMKISVSGTNAKRQLTCSGSICLVDLAGSERYEDNNSVDRRKETMCINKSLSSLTNVIMALKQKNDHVPYRVSKLTHLLMPCLGGSAKTLMIVNISPLRDCFSESVNSLRFANSVNQCQVVAKKNEKTTATL